MYEDDGTSSRISSIAWGKGRISYDGGSNICDEWHVRDHLGSVRAIAGFGSQIAGIRELNGYLPFGTRIPNCIQVADNRHRLNGKEEQRYGNFNLGLSDFGARYYDPCTCRWTTRDPLAGKYHSLSPYNYCVGDPVNMVDPEGKNPKRKWRRGAIIVSATIYTNEESSKSASQAAKFWNDRVSDTYERNGKEYAVRYSINIVKIDNESFNPFKGRTDTYEVKPKGSVKNNKRILAGKYDEMKSAIEVDKEYSEYKPGTKELSSTGAHELGHYLGIDKKAVTIMCL